MVEQKCEKVHSVVLLMSMGDSFMKKVCAESVDAFNIFPRKNLFFRIIRRAWMLAKFPYCFIWFDKWKYQLENYDTIIVFASYLNPPLLHWIKKKYPKKRLILWFWDPVSNCANPSIIKDSLCEKWSFDSLDCIKYGMRMNTTFYFSNLINSRVYTSKRDILFVGEDKGRLETLMSLEDQFRDLGLITYFHIVFGDCSYLNKRKYRYKKKIPYDSVLEMAMESKAILEILQNEQSGMSLRCMESLFLKVKLITNNPFVATYDFYDPNNIFILGQDNLSDLPAFISTPYQNVSDLILRKYSIHCWIDRFFR